MKKALMAVAVAGCFGLAACAANSPTDTPAEKPMPAKQAETANPLLQLSDLPYHYPQFDKIKDEHFAPAFRHAVSLHRQELEAIATDTAQPLLLAIQAAMLPALAEQGVRPAMVLGHSVGEVAAAHAAGELQQVGERRTQADLEVARVGDVAGDRGPRT